MKFLLLQAVVMLAISEVSRNHVDAARILSILPFPAKSHWFAIKPLFLELSGKGHNITLYTSIPDDDVPAEWEVISLPAKFPKSGAGLTPMTIYELTPFSHYDLIVETGLEICEDVFKEEAIKTLIRTKEKKFDLFILEYFNHNCLLAIAHKFGIPVVGFSSFGGFTMTTDAVGDPYPLSYVPDGLIDFTDHMTFWQRLTNVLIASYARFFYHYYHIPKADEIVRRHFEDAEFPSISVMEANTSLLIVQTHASFAYPRPHLPNVIETGGMHAQKVKPLPKDLRSLLDAANDGVIFFSMGSFLKSDDLPEEKIQAFLTAFSNLKQLVLWKWDSDNLPGKPSNVITQKWFPQFDLLAHENVRLFITHGGLQSTLEAASVGVPLVGVPAMGEQRHNVQRAAAQGLAVRLDLRNVTARSVEWAVREVLDNPRYRESARLRARLFHDRPQTASATALYWTEYVLRHGGAPHLRSAALNLAWHQQLLLDVLAAAALAAVAGLAAVYLALRALISRTARKTTKTD